MCRHWRKTFLQHGALWSQLFLEHGKNYVTTLLERAKGSALEIFTDHRASLDTIPLFSSYARQIRRLEFRFNCLTEVSIFSEANSGPLPLLRTLKIYLSEFRNPHGLPNIFTSPSLPLFSGAVNLKEFALTSNQAGLLNRFVFPNLTLLTLDTLRVDGLDASHLFDFLKASPMLRMVDVKVGGGIRLGNIPRDMVVVLPNVEFFSLLVRNNAHRLYETVAHISCPNARYTCLTLDRCEVDMATGLEIFPDPILWKEIARQYGSSLVEEVMFQMVFTGYTLTFQSSDATVIELSFEITEARSGEAGPNLAWGDVYFEMFSQACSTIRSHPILSHIKRLDIEDNTGLWGDAYAVPAASEIRDLFKCLGPLDELIFYGQDPQIFLSPFVDLPEFRHLERVFPPVKKLEVSGRWEAHRERCMEAVVELAKSQHKLGIPFEHVTVRAREVPTDMTERLREWVSAADCFELRF